METNQLIKRRDFIKSSALGIGALALGGIGSSVQAASKTTASQTKLLILNFNENSLGMSEVAKKAITERLPEAFRYLRYSSQSPRGKLLSEIAHQFGLEEKNVTLGNGSSETIQAIVQALTNKYNKANMPIQIVIPDPTFEAAEDYAKPLNITIEKVPLTKDMVIDLKAMHSKVSSFKGASIVYICNPNNPTGMTTPFSELENWIKNSDKDTYFMVDEAYGEFADPKYFKSCVPLVKSGVKNLVITKTFSKIYALAGLRIGYGLGSEEIIATIRQFVEGDNINQLGCVAALASLKDKSFALKSIKSNQESKKLTEEAFDKMKIKYLPTQANFMFYKVKADLNTYIKEMEKNNIIVGREFKPITDYNRVTLGTPAEMKHFISVVEKLHMKGMI